MSGWRIYLSPKMLMMLLLGFSSGMPLALTGGTLSAWLKDEGFDLKKIGVFALVGLPYAFKFLWAPLLDRYKCPGLGFLGRRRGWMLFSQLALLVVIALMGQVSPAQHLAFFSALAVMVAFLSATQDIALDAWRTENLRPEERGGGASVWIMGYRLAMLVSGAVALILADHWPWSWVYALMGLVMAGGALATLFAPENSEGQAAPAPANLKIAVIGPLAQFLSRPESAWILIFLLCYKMGDIAASQMVTPYVMDVGPKPSEIIAQQVGQALNAQETPSQAHVTLAGPTRWVWQKDGVILSSQGMGPWQRVDSLPLRLDSASSEQRLAKGGQNPALVLATGDRLYATNGIDTWILAGDKFRHMWYTKSDLGSVVKVVGMIATILGGLVGGAMMATWSLRRALFVFGVLQGLAILLFPLLQWGEGEIMLLGAVIGLEYFANALGTAAYTAFMMALCDIRFTATQYALVSSLMAVSRTLAGAPTGYLAEGLGWTGFFVVCCLAAFPALLLLRKKKMWEGL